MTKPLMMLFPPWRLGSNVKSADDTVVESLSEGSVVAEWIFAAIVVLGVVAEFVIAAHHPAYDTWLGWWGPAYADLLVASGVAGEVFASVIAHVCQNDLTRRTNDKLGVAIERTANAERGLIIFRRARRDVLAGSEGMVTARLKPFSGTPFDTGMAANSGEQADFLWALEPFIRAAGWPHFAWIGTANIIRQGDRVVSGAVAAQNVEIHLHPEWRERLLPAATALIDVLNEIGIAASDSGFNSPSANHNAVHIQIGEKR